MVKSRNVALLIESSRIYGREILRGVGNYASEHGTWSICYQERTLGGFAPTWLRKRRVDGIIARIDSRRLADQILGMNLPAVDLRTRFHLKGIPIVSMKPGAVERAAARHLLDCGFKNFGYCGIGGLRFSDWRRDNFGECLAAEGFEASGHESPRQPHTFDTPTIEARAAFSSGKLVKWLRSLPKPVGVMACNDIRAQQVLSVCRTNGIAVPEDVAIIGVANDDVLCNLCVPSLSSVAENVYQLGYQAAALLDRMMNDRRPAADVVVDEPVRVVARQSTNVLAVDDLDVRAALRFIRKEACKGIRVKNVLEHVMISHATMKRRFAELLGRSPKDEIIRVQLQRVKDALVMTDWPLWRIAETSGFNNLECMCRLFKKKTGQTPGQYRAGGFRRRGILIR